MAKRRTSVIQVMITGDASDLNKATKSGSQGMSLLGAAAITAAKVVTSAISGIAAFSIREFARFDQAMTQSQAIMGDLSDSTKKAMADVAREVGVTTTFAAHEAAEAFYFLSSAGLTAEQSIAAMPRVAAFAQAGMFDLARATDILTDAQSALGMGSEDAAENLANMTDISNVLVGIATKANASVEQFGEAFMRAGARIRMVGVPIEEAAAVLGAFADQGTKGAAGGEALNIILRDLPRAAAKNAGAFRQLGIQVENADGSFRPMADIVGDFEKALGGLSATQQATVFSTLGLTRSVADNLSQLVGTSEKIRQYEADIRLMGDVTQEVADKQLQSFSNQIALTRAQFTNIALTIGEALAGPLRQFNLWLREQTPAIEAFVDRAMPKVIEFVDKSVSKFREFKTFFDDNLREPLANFGTLVKRGFEVAYLEFLIFKSRFRTFSDAFREAIEESDPEAAGEALGKFIAATFRQAFARVEELGALITGLFGDQPWESIGRAVGQQAAPFVKGFFKGLFAKPDDWLDEYRQGIFDRNVKTISERFRDDFVTMFVGVMIASKIPVLKWFVAPILAPLRAGAGMIAARIAPVAGSTVLGALWPGIRGAFFALRFLLTGAGALFGTFIATPLANAIRAGVAALPELIAPVWQRLLIAVRGQFSAWAFRFGGVAGATIRQAIGVLVRVAIRSLITGVGAIVVGFFGWPVVLAAAAAAAFFIFIRRFARWNEDQGDEYEGFGKRIVTFIGQGVTSMVDWFMSTVGKWFGDRWQDTKDLLAKLPWAELGGNIISGVVNGITGAASRLGDSLVTAAKDAWDRVNKFFRTRSPSLLFAGLGENLMLGMAKGIDASARAVTDAMRDVSVDTAGVRFDAPQVPSVSRDGSGQQPIIINVTGALDAEGVARQIERILRDSQRRTGGVLV